MNDRATQPPKSHGHAVISTAGIAASLLAAVAIHRLTTDGEHLVDVFAGWLVALGTFSLGHVLLLLAKKKATHPLLALGVIKLRLFSLILIYLVVLVGELFRAGPFTTGMLCGYLVAGWVEIGTLARGFFNATK